MKFLSGAWPGWAWSAVTLIVAVGTNQRSMEVAALWLSGACAVMGYIGGVESHFAPAAGTRRQ